MNLLEELQNDPLLKIWEEKIEEAKGVFEGAWVAHENVKWHPVITKEQKTGKRGFCLNPKGKWGSNEEVGRERISLARLFELVIQGHPDEYHLRCKTRGSTQRNGRFLKDIKFQPQLEELITAYRKRIK